MFHLVVGKTDLASSPRRLYDFIWKRASHNWRGSPHMIFKETKRMKMKNLWLEHSFAENKMLYLGSFSILIHACGKCTNMHLILWTNIDKLTLDLLLVPVLQYHHAKNVSKYGYRIPLRIPHLTMCQMPEKSKNQISKSRTEFLSEVQERRPWILHISRGMFQIYICSTYSAPHVCGNSQWAAVCDNTAQDTPSFQTEAASSM